MYFLGKFKKICVYCTFLNFITTNLKGKYNIKVNAYRTGSSKMRSLLVILAVLGVFWTQVNGCCIADGDRNANGANITKLTVSSAILKYTLDQYKTMIAQNGTTNIFTSPFSIWTALANLYLGSREESSVQLGTVLGLQGYDKGDVEKAMLELAQDVVSETGDRFLVANKLAFNNVYKIRDCLIGDSFEVEAMNFAEKAEEERQRVNQWVESKTENKIKDLLPEGSVDDSTLLIILNAVYFKGSWQNKFEKSITHKTPFYSQNSRNNDVDMMFRRGRTLYYSDPDSKFAAVDLPYASGSYAMTILLPEGTQTVDSLLNHMTPESMLQVFSSFYNTTVEVKLPKFKLDSSYSLKETIKALGANKMFKSLNVSGIMETTGPAPYVKAVFHKAFMNVDEEGTEAAAATAILTANRVSLQFHTRFTVNRPFIAFIRDVKTNSVMFVGVVRNL